MSVLTSGIFSERRRPRTTVTLATAFLLAAAIFTPIPAHAAVEAHGFGYVWANEATKEIGVEYTPSTSWNFNSTGASNTAVHLGTGRYRVRFPGYGPFGTAMVTAYGKVRLDDYCKINAWTTLPGIDATDLFVNCFDRDGVPADTMFTATYTDPEQGMPRGAFLWNERASNPIDSAYEPSLSFQFNSTGNRNWVDRYATGRYLVGLTGLGPTQGPGDFLVTAYGTFPNPTAYCTVKGTNEDSFSVFLNVDCLTPSGDFADSQFVVSYIESGDTLFTPTGSRRMAYADITCTDIFGSRGICFILKGRPSDGLTVKKVENGEWRVLLPVALSGGNVQVTTFNGEPKRRCKVGSWGDGDGVRVVCRDRLGQAVTRVRFIVSYVA
jgi:hypothetical protein